jgi:hypothetical protein
VTQVLPRTGHPLILWNPASQKWQDPGNDYWCHQSRDTDGGWEVVARYHFGTPGESRFKFPTEHEAMEFYVNWLVHRREESVRKYFNNKAQREQAALAPDATPATPA